MRRPTLAWLSLGLLLVLPPPVFPAAPAEVPLQGVLTDANGVPLDGNADVTFSIYDMQSGGTALWSETRTVAVDNGLFTVYLGQVNAIDLTWFRDHGDLWLGIRVGADLEMSRIKLGSAPFSAYAEYTGDALAGVPDGMIGVFDGACPPGWTRMGAFDGLALRGAPAYGGTGGADTHNHRVNPPDTGTSQDGAHAHGTNLTTRGIGHTHTVDPPGTTSSDQSQNHEHGYFSGSSGTMMTAGITRDHNHSVDIGPFTSGSTDPTDRYADGTNSAGNHTHSVDIAGFDSDDSGSWPPYIDVVYCKKNPTRRAVTLHLPGRGTTLARENRLLRTQVEALEARLNRLEGQLRGRKP
jgi:hypothetical protein